jgi:parallel beta-helix repeat protein
LVGNRVLYQNPVSLLILEGQMMKKWSSIRFRLIVVALSIVILGGLVRGQRPLHAEVNTDVCGPITSNTTWTLAGSPYIVTCDVQVNNGVILTIQSGVTVKFNLGTSLLVNGALIADNCTFTTNDPTPARDDWGHILFSINSIDAAFDASGNYLSGSKIQGCLVEWGGGGASVLGAIETSTASPFISQNTIRNNGDSGIYATGRSTNQPIRINGNHVSNNQAQQTGNGIHVTFGQLTGNTVTGNYDGGAGVYAVNSTLTSNQIVSNEGGLHSIDSIVTNNTISDNTGRGIRAEGGELIENTVTGNTQTGWEYQLGGGINISGGIARENIVTGNYVDSYQRAFGGGFFATSSTIISNTVEGNTVSYGFGGGIYADGGNVVGNIVRGNTAADNGTGGGIHAKGATAENNFVENNSASNGGGLYGEGANLINNMVNDNQAAQNGGGIHINSSSTAFNNMITGNSAASGGGVYSDGGTVSGNTLTDNIANDGAGVYAIQSTVLGNTMSQNTAQSNGGGLYLDRGTAEYNTATNNNVPSFGHGSGAYLMGTVSFRYNHITANVVPGNSAGGLAINGQPTSLQLNNLFDNEPYDTEILATGDVIGTLNYWGDSPCTAIPAQIYDGNDIPGRGRLSYAPSLYSPIALAQMSTPANLTLTEGETSVALSWTAVPDLPAIGCRPPGATTPELGYRLYYDTDSACVFDGDGLPMGDSPIDIGANANVTITGLGNGPYYFSVTAYDYLGRESPFSNIVSRAATESSLYLPMIIRN